jgi:endoglucanase Acf2
MSITVGLWNDQDLANIGKDKWLTTIFMNKTTFSETESKHYPYELRKEYVANIEFDGFIDTITFYATDDKMAVKFITTEYIAKYVKSVTRVNHTYKYIPVFAC